MKNKHVANRKIPLWWEIFAYMYSVEEFEARAIGTPFFVRCLIIRLAPGNALASLHLSQFVNWKGESLSESDNNSNKISWL